jgi:hypothetical protein
MKYDPVELGEIPAGILCTACLLQDSKSISTVLARIDP